MASYLKPKSHKSGASINDLTTSASNFFPTSPQLKINSLLISKLLFKVPWFGNNVRV
jgi:hypothetical protein